MKTPYFFYLLLVISSAASADINQAQALFEQGHADQALPLVERELINQPNDLQARFLKAQLLAKLNRTTEAINLYEALTRDYPQLPEPYNNLAVLYAANNQHDKARDALLRALNTHPSYATAYGNLGSIYAKMAISAYNKALELGKQQRPSPISLDTISKIANAPLTVASPQTPVVIPKQNVALNQAATQIPDVPLNQALVQQPRITQPQQQAQPVTQPIVDNEQTTELIMHTLNNWSNAWSQQNVTSYLSYYAPSFQPHNGLSRKRWEKQRRQRLSSPNFIHITITEPKVKILGDSTAKLSFQQRYESDRFKDTQKKVLLLEKINGQWQILREYST